MQPSSSDFEVARNVIEGSGHGLEAKDVNEPWADGITLHNCWGGEGHDNKVVDATAVGIVSGGGSCSGRARRCGRRGYDCVVCCTL